MRMHAVHTPSGLLAFRARAAAHPPEPHGPAGRVVLPSDRDQAAMQAAYRPTGGLASGDELARLIQDHRCGELLTLAGLVGAGDIFGFDWHGTFRVPMFQFDLHDLSIRPQLRPVLELLAPVFDGLALAVWFAQPNCWLGGRRPVELLVDDLPAVLQAAATDRHIATG